jgi:hypothetical protein
MNVVSVEESDVIPSNFYSLVNYVYIVLVIHDTHDTAFP